MTTDPTSLVVKIKSSIKEENVIDFNVLSSLDFVLFFTFFFFLSVFCIKKVFW